MQIKKKCQKTLIQCNICISQASNYGNNKGMSSSWSAERPYFCNKIDLQLHFRGKHTREYLQMVSAVTGKPAGKSVQLGRHNYLKGNLNIRGNDSPFS